MMNETGSYPGQVWLWLYTFWYQIAPFNTSDNADAQICALMVRAQSLAFICIPFIPGPAQPAAPPRRPPPDLARPLPARRGRLLTSSGALALSRLPLRLGHRPVRSASLALAMALVLARRWS